MRSLLVLTVGLILAPGAGYADEAAKIRDAIVGWPADQSILPQDSSMDLESAVVTREGEGYRVTIPETLFSYLGVSSDLGEVGFTVDPLPDGSYAFGKVSLPRAFSFELLDEAGIIVSDVTWTPGRIEGVWNDLWGMAKAAKIELRDIRLLARQQGVLSEEIALDAFIVDQVTEVRADGLWDMAQRFALEGFFYVIPAADQTLSLGALVLESSSDSVRPDAFEAYIRANEDFTAAFDFEAEGMAARRELKSAIDLLPSLLDAFPLLDGSISMQDLVLVYPDDSGSGDLRTTLELSALLAAAKWSMLEGDKRADISFTLAADEFSITDAVSDADPGSGVVRALIPDTLSLPIRVESFPIRFFGEALSDLTLLSYNHPEAGDLFDDLMMRSMGLAQTRILVDGSYIATPGGARLDLSGSLIMDLDSALGLTGGADLTLTGLQKLERLVTTLPEDRRLVAFGAIALLKGLGKPQPQDGEIVYTYAFELGSDGVVILNGQNLSRMIENFN